MSFSLVRKVDPNLVDVRTNYKKIAEDLLTLYYNTYDSDYSGLTRMYYSDSQFTYRDYEFYGFENLVKLWREKYGVFKFTHTIVHSTVQPIGKTDLLVSVHGTLSVNNSVHADKFIETLLIRREDDNTFKIMSTIFKIVN